MAYYFSLWTISLLGSLLLPKKTALSVFLFYAFCGVLTVFVGIRFNIGGDWHEYINIFRAIGDLDFLPSLLFTDPNYGAINWIANKSGLGIIFVNMLCSVIFFIGLAMFCKRQNYPWVGVMVAIPYLVFVVAMGYTRQASAIGLVLLAFCSAIDGNGKKFLFYIVLATLFHKSAALTALLYPIINSSNSFKSYFALALGISLLLYIMGDTIAAHLSIYLFSDEISSEGGSIRIVMNIITALIFFIFMKIFKERLPNPVYKLIYGLSFFSFASMLMILVSTTVADRLTLYAIPVQILVYSNISLLFSGKHKLIAVIFPALISFTTLVVWLNYSPYASCCWIPYDFSLDIFKS